MAGVQFFYGHLKIFNLASSADLAQVIYPYSLVNEKEWILAFSKNSMMTKNSIVNRSLDLLFPEWTRSTNGIRVRLPFRFAVLSKLTKFLTYNPWLQGANLSIPIFAPDKFTFKYLVSSGYDPAHLHLGGVPSGKELAQARRRYLNNSKNTKTKKPLVTIALPPDQTSDTTGMEYRGLLRALIFEPCAALAENCTFAFVLHPRINGPTKDWLKSLEVKILNGSLAERIAESDIYIACASATLRIAEALAVPAIDYDIYDFGYQDFSESRVVQVASNPDELKLLVKKLLLDSAAFEIDLTIELNPTDAIHEFITKNLEAEEDSRSKIKGKTGGVI